MAEAEILNDILRKLEQLKKLDSNFQVFGAAVHQYVMNPVLTDDDIVRVEAKYGCRFPGEYRQFLIELGNGGAGPYYGIFPLEMQDDGHDLGPWEGGYLIGDISKPFPHDCEWNLPESFWSEQPDPNENTSEEEEDEMWKTWDEKLEKFYWASDIMNGAIPICHEGCAGRDWLVVTGPFAGAVWMDYRADNLGIKPRLGADGTLLSFRAWYRDWLDSSIDSLLGL